MIPITALVLTFNERENIASTLSALAWLDRILVVDSFSTDRTVEIVREFANAEIIERKFKSFADQCNFGLNQIRTEWVLSIDADYILTPEVSAEIAGLDPGPDIAGYSVAFRYCIFGHPLRNTAYPSRTVLYRRDHAEYEDEGHGHRVRIRGKIVLLVGKIDHDDRKPLSRWIQNQDQYATIEARHLLSASPTQLTRQDRLRLRIYFAPAVMFLYLLFGRGLILDGWPGWYYVFQRTLAEMLLSLRLLTEREKLEMEIPK